MNSEVESRNGIQPPNKKRKMKYLFALLFIITAPLLSFSQKNVVMALFVEGVDTTNIQINHALVKAGDKALRNSSLAKSEDPNSIFGWNFLGSKDGKININSLGTESFRTFQNLHVRYIQNPKSLTNDELELYAIKMKENGITSYLNFLSILETINRGAQIVDSMVLKQFGENTILLDQLTKLDFSTFDKALEIPVQAISGECTKGAMKGFTKWKEVHEKAVNDYTLAKERVASLSVPNSNPRYTLGDDMTNFEDMNYGNRNVMCDQYAIGSALVGFVLDVNPDAKIMPLRVNADGESFDKDIYNAIRFATDNGARVIIITEVKASASDSDRLEEALNYATAKDVLIVIGAGDKSKDLNKTPFYPLAIARDNVIKVGSTGKEGEIAKFSNYGIGQIDLFTSGEDIKSKIHDNSQDLYSMFRFSGTAISASIVGGLCAKIRAENPKMKASQVKSRLMKMTKKIGDIQTL